MILELHDSVQVSATMQTRTRTLWVTGLLEVLSTAGQFNDSSWQSLFFAVFLAQRTPSSIPACVVDLLASELRGIHVNFMVSDRLTEANAAAVLPGCLVSGSMIAKLKCKLSAVIALCLVFNDQWTKALLLLVAR